MNAITPTQSPTAGRAALAVGERESAAPIPRALSRFLCESCRVHPARRDVPLCSHCLYAH
jgi:hypothetical protein